MKQRFENNAVNGATTKKKYVSPEIEVVNLDEQPKLLSASPNGGPFGLSRNSDADEEW